ncbi:MAG: E2/UBC family protein [Gammaproteobacteria bacterium]|nr:E2/UBC family protein [Gammaproteobacteria bacterium]
MALLFDEDYKTLAEANLAFEEDETSRYLIFKDFPLPPGIYRDEDGPRLTVDVLYVVPPNYNTEGGDMFWVRHALSRIDGVPIPSISGPNQDSRTCKDVEYFRWSRHWNHNPWKAKIDNVRTIIDRLTWAFKYPDAKRV